MSEWTYHRAFPYSDASRKERKVSVWQSQAKARDGRRPIHLATSEGLGPHRDPASEGKYQLPSSRPQPLPKSPRRGVEAPASSAWINRARTPTWGHETNAMVNRAQLAKLGTGPLLWLSHPPPPPVVRPPVNQHEIAEGGPFLEFFLQRPLSQKKIKDSIPAARNADARERKRRDAAQLRLETERLNDSLRFLESIGISPRKPKPPPAANPLFTDADDDSDDDVSTGQSSRLELEMTRMGYRAGSGRPSTAGSLTSRASRPGSSRPASSRAAGSRPASSSLRS